MRFRAADCERRMSMMQLSTAQVVGTDGHRTLCRHEGWAYMTLFGPPLIFLTPNLADTKQILLLIVQGEEIALDSLESFGDVLPKYRDMVRRLAEDPVSQAVVFEKMIQLFFRHVLNVRPETLQCRRKQARRQAREWCTDGAACSSTGAGMLGPVLAFRGEIEAQGRGSLHPHILVWLVCQVQHEMDRCLRLLQHDPAEMKRRLGEFMKCLVASQCSVSQASTEALPRVFGEPASQGPTVALSSVAAKLSAS